MPGEGKVFLQPIEDDRVAGQEFRAGLTGQPPVVVATGHVERDEEHRAEPEAGVFRIFSGLALDWDFFLAERQAVGPEQAAQLGETFERIVAAVRDPVAIRPFVVAGRKYEGGARGVEYLPAILEETVVAALATGLDVADVGDECDLGIGDGVEHFRQFGPLALGIGRIANDCKAPDVGVGVGRHSEQQRSPFQFWPNFPVHRGNGASVIQRSRPLSA